ncbi:hypothetical protein, partial [Paramagnetospirillum marisnigri]|uniref:hypothetical protein n=1 Tax=Paramagnetospirillum marisnigri TaxID=1285242 RepID=UPI001C129F71
KQTRKRRSTAIHARNNSQTVRMKRFPEVPSFSSSMTPQPPILERSYMITLIHNISMDAQWEKQRFSAFQSEEH